MNAQFLIKPTTKSIHKKKKNIMYNNNHITYGIICTVLLAVYNNKDDIINAIKSVINQSLKNWELIIIDDCSTDGTYEIIKEFINNYTLSNIYLYRNEINKGVYVSLNEGLLKANGKYIARIDSDDIYDRMMLEEQINVLEKNNYLIASQSKYKREGDMDKFGEITLVYRHKVIKEIGFYDSVRFSADTEFYQRMKKVYGVNKIHQIYKTLYYAKKRNNSLTTNENTGLVGQGKYIRQEYLINAYEWHNRNNVLYISYPLTRRLFDAPKSMLP